MTYTPPRAGDAALARGPASPDAPQAELEAELPRLTALAYSILRDREQAADAVQDTAEQAWRNWGALRQLERRGAWLATICVRQALRRARLERRQRLIPWHQRPEGTGRDPDVKDVDLERALHNLSVRQRAVVGLHYLYGYSLDEVAAVLGCRPGTARSHLSRALTTLRELLEVNPDGPNI